MENVIVFECKPDLHDPIFIEGLPGVGNVGKIAADYLKEKLGAKKFAEIYSKHFPPHVTVDMDSVANLAHDELWYIEDANGKDLILLLGDYQGSTSEGHFEMAEYLMNVLQEMHISKMFTLGGYGTGQMVENPRVLGAVSSADMKAGLEECGVTFSPNEPGAGIMGASGILIGFGKMRGIPSACLMGETSGYFADHKSASVLLRALNCINGLDVDMADIDERSKQIESLTEKVREFENNHEKDDLGYIG